MRSVLLVEDDAGLRLALGDRLVEEGYRVAMAAGAEEALARAAAERFDLVVLDAGRPEHGGLEACGELRRRGFDGGVILLFDGVDPADRVVGFRLGADDCVPMSPREYQLLRCLVEHAGTPLSRDQILDRAWGRDAMPTPRTVDVHVAWLRHKLEADPHRPTLIRTVHGVGYLFAGGPA
jgi:DNA-binding response OmpR family regulator